MDMVRIRVIDYDGTELREVEAAAIEECFAYRDSDTVSWINIDGLHDAEVIRKIGEHYGLHPLLCEDIANPRQRPKLEEHESHLALFTKMLYYDAAAQVLNVEQISFVLGPGYLISFQEREGDVFAVIRERIRQSKGRIRSAGNDYLLYSLVDAIVDHYFVVLEQLGDQIEELEEGIVENPSPETMKIIHNLKREMIILRKAIWPLREVVSGWERTESKLIRKSTRPYLRDLYDHTIQILDIVESYRDMIAAVRDTYMTSVSNKMNEVMKVLTIFASIFIPLTFIAGIYGMNFNPEASPYNMPELNWAYSYPVFWLAVVVMTGAMLVYFWKKRWL